MESYFIFECRRMIFCKLVYFVLLLNLFLGCGTQLALSGQARENYLKSVKTYGAYFFKPGVSREEWQRDWVACGGRPNGQYSDDAPPHATTKEIFAAIYRARNSLDSCMKSKGYEYREAKQN
jgi:hypothetical protein